MSPSKASEMLGLLKVGVLLQVTKDRKAALEAKFPKVFSGLGKLKGYQLKFHINEKIQPVVQPVRSLVLWETCSNADLMTSMERLHCRAARIIFNLAKDLPFAMVLEHAKWPTFHFRYKLGTFKVIHKGGSPRGLWGTREQGNFYNGNTGTKQKNHGEQGNIKYIGEQGNKPPLLVCTTELYLIYLEIVL